MCNDFCKWLSEQTNEFVDLPSEYQWEAAARGGDDRLYPWGNSYSGDGSYAASHRKYVDVLDWNFTVPVGCYAAGAAPCGALDMAGNVWEWTRDELFPYPGAKIIQRENNNRVVRGGCYKSKRKDLRCAVRREE